MTASPDHLHPNLVVSSSKAISVLFTRMRDVNTSSADFVKYSKRAMRILAEDALAEFTCNSVTISTPCTNDCKALDCLAISNESDICAVSIIRSGDSLLEVVRDIVPACRVGKILIQRDEEDPDKPAKLFYSKMPEKSENLHILLCDPMLASGGSAIVALNVLCKDYGIAPERIIFANMICAPEGLQVLAEAYPQVKIVTACIDDGLNADKYIVPGLGDYGDRFFNT